MRIKMMAAACYLLLVPVCGCAVKFKKEGQKKVKIVASLTGFRLYIYEDTRILMMFDAIYAHRMYVVYMYI